MAFLSERLERLGGAIGDVGQAIQASDQRKQELELKGLKQEAKLADLERKKTESEKKSKNDQVFIDQLRTSGNQGAAAAYEAGGAAGLNAYTALQKSKNPKEDKMTKAEQDIKTYGLLNQFDKDVDEKLGALNQQVMQAMQSGDKAALEKVQMAFNNMVDIKEKIKPRVQAIDKDFEESSAYGVFTSIDNKMKSSLAGNSDTIGTILDGRMKDQGYLLNVRSKDQLAKMGVDLDGVPTAKDLYGVYGAALASGADPDVVKEIMNTPDDKLDALQKQGGFKLEASKRLGDSGEGLKKKEDLLNDLLHLRIKAREYVDSFDPELKEEIKSKLATQEQLPEIPEGQGQYTEAARVAVDEIKKSRKGGVFSKGAGVSEGIKQRVKVLSNKSKLTEKQQSELSSLKERLKSL